MKILWMSDSPTHPTGFGNVTRAICAGLADCGHQVSILGWQTREQVRWHRGSNSTLYPLPLQHQITVNDVVEYLRRLQPDVFVILGKVMAFSRFNHPLIARFVHTAGITRALYYPIDGDLGNGRLPPEWIDILKTVDLPIAMSRYGAEVSQTNGVRPAYIPLGVDTKVFHPPESKEQAKHALGYDGQFVILTDARNQQRKQLPRTLEIFRRFAADKDNVLLHLHCDPEDPAARWQDEYCYDLRSEIAALGLTSKVRITPRIAMGFPLRLPMTQLAKIYQVADVHLLASWGEGFGLPTLQAAAAGVVPLATDYSASRELVGEHGEAIRVHHFWPGLFGVRHAFIDMDDAVSRLERLYRDRERLITKAHSARRFAESYDWQHIVREWHDLLQRQVLPKARYSWLRIGKTGRKDEIRTPSQVNG